MKVPSENTAKLDIPTSIHTAFSDFGRTALGASSTRKDTCHFFVEDRLIVRRLMVPSMWQFGSLLASIYNETL